ARAGADLQLIESDDIALHAHLRADRSLLAVDLALNRNRIRPALTHELVQWAEVSFERNGGVVDLAAEATADGRLCVASVHRQVLDQDGRDVAGLAVAVGDRAAGDRDIADRKTAQRSAGGCRRRALRRGGRCRKFPVALAAGIGLEHDRRLDQLEADDFEALAQERQERDLRLDMLGGDHLRLLAPGRVAQSHIVEHELWLEPQLEIDAAAHFEIASGRVLDALLDRAHELVDVDGMNGDCDRDQQQHDHAAERGQGSPENAHARIVSRSLALRVRTRKCRGLATTEPASPVRSRRGRMISTLRRSRWLSKVRIYSHAFLTAATR